LCRDPLKLIFVVQNSEIQRMMNLMKLILALLTFAITTAAPAQQRTLYDSRGNVAGRSATDSSGAVTNYDARGKVISRESTSGSTTTTIYDDRGRNVGSSRLSPR
jgi:YD repeat-containing protein